MSVALRSGWALRLEGLSGTGRAGRGPLSVRAPIPASRGGEANGDRSRLGLQVRPGTRSKPDMVVGGGVKTDGQIELVRTLIGLQVKVDELSRRVLEPQPARHAAPACDAMQVSRVAKGVAGSTPVCGGAKSAAWPPVSWSLAWRRHRRVGSDRPTRRRARNAGLRAPLCHAARWARNGALTVRAPAAGGAQLRAGSTSPAEGESARREFDRLVSERLARGEDRQAAGVAFTERPGLREALLAEGDADCQSALERLQHGGTFAATAGNVTAAAPIPSRAATPSPAEGKSAKQPFDRRMPVRGASGEDRQAPARAMLAEGHADRQATLEQLHRGESAAAAVVDAATASSTRGASPLPATGGSDCEQFERVVAARVVRNPDGAGGVTVCASLAIGQNQGAVAPGGTAPPDLAWDRAGGRDAADLAFADRNAEAAVRVSLDVRRRCHAETADARGFGQFFRDFTPSKDRVSPTASRSARWASGGRTMKLSRETTSRIPPQSRRPRSCGGGPPQGGGRVGRADGLH